MLRKRNLDYGWAILGLAFTLVSMAVVGVRARDAQPATSHPSEMDDEPVSGDDRTPDSTFIRRLTKAEINRIRFMELRGMRLPESEQPDRVTVKIPQAIVDEFLIEMQGEQDFSNENARREFRKLTPPQKLHIIAKRKGDSFADKVDIQSDPEVFVEFRKKIMPSILRSCATAGCHAPGLEQETHFSLFKDVKKSPSTTYANFVVLTELFVDDMPLINRSQPENSLLLTYLLPTKDVKASLRHRGKEELRPVFQSRSAPGFRRLERWIASLKHPQSNYGVQLLPQHELPNDNEPGKKPDAPEPRPSKRP